jgi:hypothetical protein
MHQMTEYFANIDFCKCCVCFCYNMTNARIIVQLNANHVNSMFIYLLLFINPDLVMILSIASTLI